MSSTTSLVARQYRLQQWASQIHECQNRSVGMTVKDWCNQHNLTTADYYYRFKEVRKACLDNLPCNTIPQSLVPVPSELINDNTVTTSELELSINNVCIHVTSKTSPELLKMVLQVAADVQ